LNLKITDVEAFLMSYAMPQPIKLPFYNGERTILKRDAMLIRIKTDKGITGYAPGPAHERARKTIGELIRPQLIGKKIGEYSNIQLPDDLNIRKNFASVELALLDIQAKAADIPLYEILGGKKRDRIKLYGSAGMYMSPEEYAQEAAAIKNMDFSAYKMRPALGPEEDLKTIALMREATGKEFGLMIDAHAWWRMGDKSYTFETVKNLAKEMRHYLPSWLEEPLPPEDHMAYQKLRQNGFVKIASGEHEPDDSGFMDLINSSAVDFIQMDLFCQGGLKTAGKIFQSIQNKNIRFAFHSWGTALEVLVAAHLGICWPENVVEWLEYPCYSHNHQAGMYPFPLADEILTDPLFLERGSLVVPDRPGIGVKINESVIKKYPFIPGPWSIFEIYSPAERIAVSGDHSIKWVQEGKS
jgi:L-alanine-DL-glutamate epimerase-like enolase superfamily enzyme